jgi:hypothetical protein
MDTTGPHLDFDQFNVHDTLHPKPNSPENDNMTNIERLTDAGVCPASQKFTEEEKEAIESLSKHEVDAIISSKDKLGEDFINKHVPHGLMF